MARLALTFGLVVVLCAPALGQEQRGSIEGLVKDASGGILPGVTVEARSPALVGAATAVTDERGFIGFRPCARVSTRYKLSCRDSGW